MLSGVSMGGLIARHALIQLENEGYNHEIEKFISMDSPQKGAVMSIEFMNHIKTNAPDNKALNSLAAKQMLRDNPFAVNNEYNTFFNSFSIKNMPTTTQNIGVAFSNNTPRVTTNNKWLSTYAVVDVLSFISALIPFVDFTIVTEDKNFYLSNSPEAFVPGSKLPLTNSNFSVPFDISEIIGIPYNEKFLFWLLANGTYYFTRTFESPTFIPNESALNLDNFGQSRFDVTVSSINHNFHDEIPEDLVNYLTLLVNSATSSVIENNTTLSQAQINSNTTYLIKDNVILTITGSGSLTETKFVLGNNSKVRFTSGSINLFNTSFSPVSPTDSYSVESISPAKIVIPNNSKVTIQGKPSFTGYRMQIDQGGELEIKDGSNLTFSDSFQFYNYGTTKIGAGVTMNLKNFSNYSSSNTLINTNNGSRTNFNISAGGVINLGGSATVKGTTFKRKTTSNFSYVGISGSAVRTVENVAIEGSQYGILVSNVPSGKVSFKSITGNDNFYSTIKANNAVFTLDGIITTNSVQDGLAAYSASTIKLTGYHSYENSLIGIRAAQYSTVTNGNEINRLPLDLSIINNTRGIHVYTNGDVNLLGTELEPLMVWLNRRTDNVYNVDDYDLYATLDGKITLSYYQNIGNISIYEDAPEDVNLINPIPSSGSQNNGYAKVNDNEGLLETNRSNSAKSKNDLVKNYRLLLKENSKQAIADYLNVNKNHSNNDIKSTAEVLFVLHASQSSDFAWVNFYDKVSRLKSLNNEDAILIAEQLFYYYTTTQPQESESAYWLKQLKKMGHEAYETGIFDVLYEQAAFNQEVVETEGTERVETDKNTVLAYPNPFNPTTSLKLSLKNKAQVQIQVFDVMGRLVQTLANNEQWQSGTHEVQFDASRLASGMYFARTQILESGKAVQTQVTKLMLIK